MCECVPLTLIFVGYTVEEETVQEWDGRISTGMYQHLLLYHRLLDTGHTTILFPQSYSLIALTKLYIQQSHLHYNCVHIQHRISMHTDIYCDQSIYSPLNCPMSY